MALPHFLPIKYYENLRETPFVPFIEYKWSNPPVLPEILEKKYVTVLNIDFHGCTLKDAILKGKIIKTCKFKKIKNWCKDKTESYDHAVSTIVNHGYFLFDKDYVVVFNEKEYFKKYLRREKLKKLKKLSEI